MEVLQKAQEEFGDQESSIAFPYISIRRVSRPVDDRVHGLSLYADAGSVFGFGRRPRT